MSRCAKRRTRLACDPRRMLLAGRRGPSRWRFWAAPRFSQAHIYKVLVLFSLKFLLICSVTRVEESITKTKNKHIFMFSANRLNSFALTSVASVRRTGIQTLWSFTSSTTISTIGTIRCSYSSSLSVICYLVFFAQVPLMTKKDTMCEQCTPAKRIVGANPEVDQQLNWMENIWKIAPEAETSSIRQPTKAKELYWSCNIVAHNWFFSSGMPYSTNMPPGNTARGVKRGEMMMFSKHFRMNLLIQMRMIYLHIF